MKKQIRRGVFETNSSSMHSLTMCSEEEFEQWKNGELLFDEWGSESFVKANSLSDDDKKILRQVKEEYDNLNGFDLGIDDYVTKPFSPKELVARIKAILKRSKNEEATYTFDGLTINDLAHEVKVDGKKVNLTPKEYDLLKYLVTNKNIALSREQLLTNIWGYDFFGDDRTIDTHIKTLRNSLGQYRKFIVTVRQVGYKFEY